MLPEGDPLVLVLPRYAKGGQPDPRNAAVPLSVALTREWAFDAHVVQYEPSDPRVRWNEEHIAEHPYRIGVAFFDFDAHELPPEEIRAWSETALAKLPPGFQGYRTSGGFRALTLLAEPHVVCDAESWNAWHAFSAGLGAALSAVLGVEADKACTDPGRIFRLPNVRREGGKPCFPELYGTLGMCTLAPFPVEPRAALQRPNDPDAVGGDTLLGALFAAAGFIQGEQGAKLVVTCPWAAEHSGGDTSGTVVMPDPDGLGLGKFHCAHGNTCGRAKGRFTWAAVAKLLELPAVQTEARHWPEPSLLGSYARALEPGAMPDWAVTRGAPEPEPDTLDDPLLTLELTEAQIHAVTYRLEHPGPNDDIAALVSERRALRTQLAELQERLRTRPIGRPLAEIRRAVGGAWETPETINYTPRAWVCRRLAIAAGRPVSVAAYGGLFKTWLIEALAVSVASGVSVFGAEIPFERKGAVLYVTREQDLAECRARLTALCNGVGVSYRELIGAGLLYVVSFPDLDFSATKATSFGAALREWALAAPAATLVVVDSQIAMAPGTDQNTDAAATSLRVLQESLTPHQCASVILMHENKGSQTVELAGKGNLALKGSASLNNATSVGIRLQALEEALPGIASLGAQTAKSVYAEFTRCQIGASPAPFILRPDMAAMNDADTEHQVALLPAAPLPEGQVFRKGRLVSDATDPDGEREPLTDAVVEQAAVSYLLSVDATAPGRSYPAAALRNGLVHLLRGKRYDLPAKDKDARALLEGLLAPLELRLMTRLATDSESFAQGRLRRKGAGFWSRTRPRAWRRLLAALLVPVRRRHVLLHCSPSLPHPSSG
jgi:hypothetical protein